MVQIGREDKDGACVLRPQGDLTNDFVPIFKAQREALVSEGQANVVVSLAGIGLLSSIGIRELMACYKDCSGAGGQLIICEMTEQVEDILDTTGLLGVFTVAKTVDEALGLF